jgi:hypothetical protein
MNLVGVIAAGASATAFRNPTPPHKHPANRVAQCFRVVEVIGGRTIGLKGFPACFPLSQLAAILSLFCSIKCLCSRSLVSSRSWHGLISATLSQAARSRRTAFSSSVSGEDPHLRF